MIIDTHSHLNFKAYQNDRDEVIERTLRSDIWMINVGTKYETSKQAVELAEKYSPHTNFELKKGEKALNSALNPKLVGGKGVFASIGLHPIFASAEFQKIKTDPEEGDFFIKEDFFDKEKYKCLAQSKKVVAIGEIGLDYYYKPKTNIKLEQFKNKQKEILLQQLDFAEELNLPVILHCRMAHKDLLEILTLRQTQVRQKKIQGVIHCFTGTMEEAQKYIDLGFYLGINGIIFKFDIDKVIKKIPLEKILVETDCPYLTPLPAVALAKAGPDGYVRNEPIFIKYVIQKIAELKGLSFDEITNKTTENARKLFNI